MRSAAKVCCEPKLALPIVLNVAVAYGNRTNLLCLWALEILKGERMNSSVQGRCLCGDSSYNFIGEVKFAIKCYCRDCQQISGGGHLPQIVVPADQFAAVGKIKSYQAKSSSGNVVEVSFCKECGSPLFKSTSKMPDVKFLCAGSLADDLVDVPFQRVFEDSRRVWDE